MAVTEQLPPRGNYRDGQDFKAMRAKNQGGGSRYAGGKDGTCAGPTPEAVFKGPTKTLEKDIKSEKITDQPSNQDRYGSTREAIRRLRPFGKPVGGSGTP